MRLVGLLVTPLVLAGCAGDGHAAPARHGIYRATIRDARHHAVRTVWLDAATGRFRVRTVFRGTTGVGRVQTVTVFDGRTATQQLAGSRSIRITGSPQFVAGPRRGGRRGARSGERTGSPLPHGISIIEFRRLAPRQRGALPNEHVHRHRDHPPGGGLAARRTPSPPTGWDRSGGGRHPRARRSRPATPVRRTRRSTRGWTSPSSGPVRPRSDATGRGCTRRRLAQDGGCHPDKLEGHLGECSRSSDGSTTGVMVMSSDTGPGTLAYVIAGDVVISLSGRAVHARVGGRDRPRPTPGVQRLLRPPVPGVLRLEVERRPTPPPPRRQAARPPRPAAGTAPRRRAAPAPDRRWRAAPR